jgi:pyruvate/2-oxoglutarate dehydrogenase complex dihydrolipoamide acyltransferase (E2) component
MFKPFKIAYQLENIKVRKAKRFSLLRETVAHLLSESARKIPHAAMIIPLDVTPLVEYAKESSGDIAEEQTDSMEKKLFHRAIRKNFSAFFIKATAHCLYHVPALNGFLDYRPLSHGGTLYQAEDINLSITVNTPAGVVRPILRNPHLKTLETVAQEMRILARKARRTNQEELYYKAAKKLLWTAIRQVDFRGLYSLLIFLRARFLTGIKPDPETAKIAEKDKLQPEDIMGATCTIANIGMMAPGIQSVTVIVPPEVFFLGIGDLHVAPLVVDGQIVPRSVMSIMGTMDHRAFDAGEAFPFHEHLMRYINNPALIYEWKPGDPI